ncbi:hypothetical protein F4813DRAFT_305184 [Daldinia decipiens]|uniref:uncharacterized protein n=1 Tax=Daldinia decipiens TaxID=326647 RepID=UPI0020C542D9|nr:uncharacterized protein F4813DRAFT_305184 [Daldinia decipiens]KAI1652630.1 hypothetical protein F4813DRAFT_305184 [Daldinia decipiens]
MGGWVSTEIDPSMIFRSFAQFVDFPVQILPLLQARFFFLPVSCEYIIGSMFVSASSVIRSIMQYIRVKIAKRGTKTFFEEYLGKYQLLLYMQGTTDRKIVQGPIPNIMHDERNVEKYLLDSLPLSPMYSCRVKAKRIPRRSLSVENEFELRLHLVFRSQRETNSHLPLLLQWPPLFVNVE